MVTKLVVAVVVIASNSRLLEGPVHAFNLSIRPRVIWFCQPVLDAAGSAEQIEHMGAPPGRRPQAVFWQVAELNAVVSEYGMDLVGDSRDQSSQEGSCRFSVRLLMELGESKFRGAIDRDKQVEFALFGTNFGDVDVEVTDRVVLECLRTPYVAFDLRQPADVMALEQTMQ